MHVLLNSIDADMKSDIGSSRGGLRPYPLRFHVGKAGAGIQYLPSQLQGLQHTPRCPVIKH
jgi:hypothetical protein